MSNQSLFGDPLIYHTIFGVPLYILEQEVVHGDLLDQFLLLVLWF